MVRLFRGGQSLAESAPRCTLLATTRQGTSPPTVRPDRGGVTKKELSSRGELFLWPWLCFTQSKKFRASLPCLQLPKRMVSGSREVLTELVSTELNALGRHQPGRRHPRPSARAMSPRAMLLGEIHPSSLSFDRLPEAISRFSLLWQTSGKAAPASFLFRVRVQCELFCRLIFHQMNRSTKLLCKPCGNCSSSEKGSTAFWCKFYRNV
jgi:hypothetical protein